MIKCHSFKMVCSISIIAKIAIAYNNKIRKNNQYYKFWIYLFINYGLIRN